MGCQKQLRVKRAPLSRVRRFASLSHDCYKLNVRSHCCLLGVQAVQRALRFPKCFVQRLRIEEVLVGHTGCVNRLAWNQDGTVLASGSDDRQASFETDPFTANVTGRSRLEAAGQFFCMQIMLWRYPETHLPPLCMETRHQANIFGVAMLPCCNDRSIVSGAMDFSVQLHRLDDSPTQPRHESTTQIAASYRDSDINVWQTTLLAFQTVES